VAALIARRNGRRPATRGGQRQFVEMPVPECTADSLQPVLLWMLETITDDHTVAELAARATMSERTFARRFVAETAPPRNGGSPPSGCCTRAPCWSRAR